MKKEEIVYDKVIRYGLDKFALYLHSFQQEKYSVDEIKNLLLTPTKVYSDWMRCHECQNESGEQCENCQRNEYNHSCSVCTDNYYHDYLSKHNMK